MTRGVGHHIVTALKGLGTNVSLSKYTNRVIESYTLMSSHLSEERTVKVYLPPEYSPDRRYPILYCHDGLEFFTHGRIATIANQMMIEQGLPPFLIAGIAVRRSRRADDYALDGARTEAYIRFVLEECIPFVEQQYLVDDHQRFMAGISLSATVTLNTYLHAPAALRGILLFSGAYYQEVMDRVRSEASLRHLHAFMTVGQEEIDVETPFGQYNFYRANQQMRDMLRLRGARLSYQESPGTHLWGFWQSQLPSALGWIGDNILSTRD